MPGAIPGLRTKRELTEDELVVGPGLPRKQCEPEPSGLGIAPSVFLRAIVLEMARQPSLRNWGSSRACGFDSLRWHRLIQMETESSVGTSPAANGCEPSGLGIAPSGFRESGEELRRSSKSRTRERQSRNAGAIPARRSSGSITGAARALRPKFASSPCGVPQSCSGRRCF